MIITRAISRVITRVITRVISSEITTTECMCYHAIGYCVEVEQDLGVVWNGADLVLGFLSHSVIL